MALGLLVNVFLYIYLLTKESTILPTIKPSNFQNFQLPKLSIPMLTLYLQLHFNSLAKGTPCECQGSTIERWSIFIAPLSIVVAPGLLENAFLYISLITKESAIQDNLKSSNFQSYRFLIKPFIESFTSTVLQRVPPCERQGSTIER